MLLISESPLVVAGLIDQSNIMLTALRNLGHLNSYLVQEGGAHVPNCPLFSITATVCKSSNWGVSYG